MENLNEARFYDGVNLEFEKTRLEDVLIEKRPAKDKEGKDIKDSFEYDIYIQFNNEDVKIATIDNERNINPNEELLDNEGYSDEDKESLGNMLNLLGLEKGKVDLNRLKEKLQDPKTMEQIKKRREQNKKEARENKENDKQEEKQDEEKEDSEKEAIAKQYNVSSKDVVHISTQGKKLTENESFSDLVKWAEGRKDVYVIADKKGNIQTVLSKNSNNEFEEVKQEMQHVHGNTPSVDIHLIGNDRIKTVKPLQIYQIDSKQAFATIRNNWGELETIYCRKEAGKEEYFGEKVPEEKSGKNQRQLGFDERSMMDSKNSSSSDLSKKHDELKKAMDYEEREVPTSEKGVQVDEINGNARQNRETVIAEIVEDLMKRDGVIDKLTVPPNYYENKAEKILRAMDENPDLKYERAVKDVEEQQKGDRDEGGRQPGEKNNRRGE